MTTFQSVVCRVVLTVTFFKSVVFRVVVTVTNSRSAVVRTAVTVVMFGGGLENFVTVVGLCVVFLDRARGVAVAFQGVVKVIHEGVEVTHHEVEVAHQGVTSLVEEEVVR